MRTRLALVTGLAALLVHAAVGSSTAAALTPPVKDKIDAGQNIRFRFTVNDEPFRGVWRWRADCGGTKLGSTSVGILDWSRDGGSFAGQACSFEFLPPDAATDWEQRVIDRDGSSNVYGGNITHDSPWVFQPLSLLPNVATRIPDLAPIAGDPDVTIYAAVNLGLYMSSNPLGFLGGAWSVGQTLSALGIDIVHGEVAGLQGIYWATTPFAFDPDPAGRGFTPVGGDANLLDSATYPYEIEILQQHQIVPEPSSVTLLGVGVLALLGRARRRAAGRARTAPEGPPRVGRSPHPAG